jgi:hypothetical protein
VNMDLGPYSQHFSSVVTYELDQSFRVFATTKPFQPFVMKHFSLVDPFVSYDENELLWIWTQGLYSQHFFLVIT